MMKKLKVILELQEKDLNMLRLIELKQQRMAELGQAKEVRAELSEQLMRKENDVLESKKDIQLGEVEIRDIDDRVKKLEGQQSLVKKVDEFNALNREISEMARKRTTLEQKIEEEKERLVEEEEALTQIQEKLSAADESGKTLEKEIEEGMALINTEGQSLQKERTALAAQADEEVLWVYERLLANKRDRVVVSLEERNCSGCHVGLTAQHENLVRKGERLVFCEHCSRIHYWPESEVIEAEKPRRRRRTVA